jgi:hypothetical protein
MRALAPHLEPMSLVPSVQSVLYCTTTASNALATLMQSLKYQGNTESRTHVLSLPNYTVLPGLEPTYSLYPTHNTLAA